MSLWRSFLSAIGSHSSDIPDTDAVDNPLPPCPDSANCIRITKTIHASIDPVYSTSIEVLKSMRPEEITILESEYKIEMGFKVFFFRDDFTVQLTEKDSESTYLHIRSASREGFSDLGVNSRRVKRFWRRLKKQL